MERCPFCLAETRPEDNFCLNCGNRLNPGTPAVASSQVQPGVGDVTLAAPDDWAAMAVSGPIWSDGGTTIAGLDQQPTHDPRVPMLRGDLIEQPARFILYSDEGEKLDEYPLKKLEISIGRATTSDIPLLRDKLTSRCHATVRYENGHYVLRDERSANGTFVNGQQLAEMVPHVLQDGDRIGIGEHELVFRAYGSPATNVEDLPTIAVPFHASDLSTFKVPDDTAATMIASGDYSTRSIDNEVSEEAPLSVPPTSEPAPSIPVVTSYNFPAPPAASAPVTKTPPSTPSASTGVNRDMTSTPPNTEANVTFNRLTSIAQPPLPDLTTLMAAVAALDSQMAALQKQFHAMQEVSSKRTSSHKTDVRYSDVSFPGRTVVGRVEALRVAITRNLPNPQAVPLPVQVPADKDQPMEVDAYVVFSPLDFDLEGSNVGNILVPSDADSAPVIFKLTPKAEGRKTIAVEFFQHARYLGRAELETTVSQKTQLPNRALAEVMLEMRTTQVPPDLTILFDRVSVGNDKYYYRYRLLSPIRELNLWFDEFRSPETSITPQGFLEELFSLLNRMIWSGNVSENLFFERLKSIGVHLYSRLFPDDLKRLYWNTLRNKVKSIVILSFEAWIPWEIVRPFDPETKQVEDGFLCEKFDLTRWLVGSGFPDTLNLEQLGLIVSVSDLASAKLESEEIKRLLGAKVKDILSSSEEVYRLLCTNECSGLHFACHGTFNKDNPDLSTLSLEDGTWLSPIDIDGDRLAFGKAKPLVFLNACETGQSGYALTGMGGWAEAFVGRAKCSGFIGSIWKANDESACKFAIALYQNLLDGKTIAEAARQARLSIKQAGDPTWLSYTVYANPLAHLALEQNLLEE